MKSTQIKVTRRQREEYRGDMLIYCLVQREKGIPLGCPKSLKKIVEKVHQFGDFNGAEKDTLLIYPEKRKTDGDFQTKRILLIGLGKIKEDAEEDELKEIIRKAGGNIAQEAQKRKAGKIMISLPEQIDLPRAKIAQAITEGVILGDYRFQKYKQKKDKSKEFKGIREVLIFAQSGASAVRKGVRLGQYAAFAARSARDMANEPGNSWTPSSFARYGRSIARKLNMRCEVLGKGELKKLGMGGILAVNQGSVEPPKMIVLEYEPIREPTQTILFVGKGLTFDSGGVSIKPSAGMEEMKYDMCGGAAVLSIMEAIGQEKPDVRVIAIVPATDNMPSGSALKPGDIIKHYNGLTSEVVNTDAEGRLILADAIAYGLKKYKPDCVVDIATLTGAVIIGLGHHYTGLLSNNANLAERLVSAGKECGEPIWQLPLDNNYREQLKSEVADVKNIGGKAAGTITAAAYLEKFVDKTPWAHLDIAGTAWNFTEKSYIPKGPSGTGVRTFLELVRNWKKVKLD